MNTAHNLHIDTLIRSLQEMKINGIRYVDATVHSHLDIGFKPSEFDHLPPKVPLKNIDLTKLT